MAKSLLLALHDSFSSLRPCSGHHNASVGDICAYCATNEREEVLFLRNLHPSLLSSLEDFELDLDNNI